ncbi:hypothetical protein ACIGXM_25170 [Kitasatospora sp. NPDC052896]|uniref:hypothetical protein n=1 Tax=Kitasatospora sp. NPDC052896 TaxID=3364061 RepID=UPI0037C6B92B
MKAMSETAIQFLSAASGTLDGPQLLWDTYESGQLTAPDLHDVIPDIWTRHDWPECAIGADRWITLFRTAGFVALPTNLAAPTAPLAVYRGATEDRARGMAWSWERYKAEEFQQRYTKLGRTTHLYTATIQPADVLAVFGTRGEHEVVVDSRQLARIKRCG